MRKSKSSNRTRHFPGDKRPGKSLSKHKLFYETKLSKHEGKMRWLVIERPTGSIIQSSHFEEDAKKLAAFQNKHKQWIHSNGIVKFLTEGKI
jgi:hypothetical protein